MSLQLAKYGFNLVLVSRSADKLEKVKAECLGLNPAIDVKTVSLDFSKAESEDFKKVFAPFGDEKMRLRVLINNAGLND